MLRRCVVAEEANIACIGIIGILGLFVSTRQREGRQSVITTTPGATLAMAMINLAAP